MFGHRHRLTEQVGSLREWLVDLTEFPLSEAGRRVLEAQRELTEVLANPAYRERYRREEVLYWLPIPGWILEWAEQARPRKIMDIGPAYGTLSVFAASTGAAVYCVDLYDFLMAEEIIERYGITFSKRNAEKDAIPWVGIDGVIMTEVLEHFNFHPVPTMRKVFESMSPGGHLFLSTPDASSWGRVVDFYNSYRDMPQVDPNVPTHDIHIYHFDAEELSDVLTDSGFSILRIERSPGRWGTHINVEAEKPIVMSGTGRSEPGADAG